MQAEIERIVGARVVALEHVEGRGYTHAGRHRALLDDGPSVFVKSAVDDLSAGWLRTEIAVYTTLRGSFLPVFHGWGERAGLPLIVLEDLGDAHWPPPWRDGDIEAVLQALRELASSPVPDGVGPLAGADLAYKWREVERDPEPFLSTGIADRAWLAENLAPLRIAAESASFAGNDLLHLDVRSDNLAIRDGRAVLVDWNWICVGNPLLDVVGWAPSLYLEGGPQPDEFVIAPEVAGFAAALAGFWAAHAGLPPPPTAAARLRESQRRSLGVVLPWACRLLGIPEP